MALNDIGPIRFVKVQAYHPRAREMNAGGVHIVPDAPIQVGRLARKRWQPLCTTRRFWDLLTTDKDADCRRCQDAWLRVRHVIDGSSGSKGERAP